MNSRAKEDEIDVLSLEHVLMISQKSDHIFKPLKIRVYKHLSEASLHTEK